MERESKVDGVSVVIACARMRTSRRSPRRRANASETTTAAAAPHVGGQAIIRVITPGQTGTSARTSSGVTTLRKIAFGLCSAWRLAFARIFANAASGVP